MAGIMAPMQVYPFKFRPIFKERIWGGQKLHTFFGKDLPTGSKIGESWELADLPQDKSAIINGALAGETIDAAIEKFGSAIVGKDDYTPPFPLLIKILDANDILSVQVHPDVATCRRMGRGDAKTECWYIIDAAPGAVIYKGLKPGVTKGQFAEAVKAGTCAELLNKAAAIPGQCHLLPAGTAHAIGPGLLIAEIQTPSDTTYRVFDWNRVDDSGERRQLHIDEALESIHFDASGDNLSVETAGRIADCEMFKVDKYCQDKDSETNLLAGQMKVLIIIKGFGTITAADIEDTTFTKGDTLLIGVAFEGKITFSSYTEYLSATV